MRNHIMSNTKIILKISCSYNFDKNIKLRNNNFLFRNNILLFY